MAAFLCGSCSILELSVGAGPLPRSVRMSLRDCLAVLSLQSPVGCNHAVEAGGYAVYLNIYSLLPILQRRLTSDVLRMEDFVFTCGSLRLLLSDLTSGHSWLGLELRTPPGSVEGPSGEQE